MRRILDLEPLLRTNNERKVGILCGRTDLADAE